MAFKLPYAEEEHFVRVAINDPVAVGYEWIKKYAENLTDRVSEYYNDDAEPEYSGGEPITAEDLIEVGSSWIDTGNRWGGDYITRGGTFEGEAVDPTFWDKLSLILEIEIPQDKRNSFFSCSC